VWCSPRQQHDSTQLVPVLDAERWDHDNTCLASPAALGLEPSARTELGRTPGRVEATAAAINGRGRGAAAGA
jgi:hypothetical protein